VTTPTSGAEGSTLLCCNNQDRVALSEEQREGIGANLLTIDRIQLSWRTKSAGYNRGLELGAEELNQRLRIELV